MTKNSPPDDPQGLLEHRNKARDYARMRRDRVMAFDRAYEASLARGESPEQAESAGKWAEKQSRLSGPWHYPEAFEEGHRDAALPRSQRERSFAQEQEEHEADLWRTAFMQGKSGSTPLAVRTLMARKFRPGTTEAVPIKESELLPFEVAYINQMRALHDPRWRPGRDWRRTSWLQRVAETDDPGRPEVLGDAQGLHQSRKPHETIERLTEEAERLAALVRPRPGEEDREPDPRHLEELRKLKLKAARLFLEGADVPPEDVPAGMGRVGRQKDALKEHEFVSFLGERLTEELEQVPVEEEVGGRRRLVGLRDYGLSGIPAGVASALLRGEGLPDPGAGESPNVDYIWDVDRMEHVPYWRIHGNPLVGSLLDLIDEGLNEDPFLRKQAAAGLGVPDSLVPDVLEDHGLDPAVLRERQRRAQQLADLSARPQDSPRTSYDDVDRLDSHENPGWGQQGWSEGSQPLHADAADLDYEGLPGRKFALPRAILP